MEMRRYRRAGILAPGGLVICEADRDDMRENLYGLTYRKTYQYGRTYVTVFENAGEGGGEDA